MKFVEITVEDGESHCLNVSQILSFSPYEGGTYLKMVDGKHSITTIPYEKFKELVM